MYTELKYFKVKEVLTGKILGVIDSPSISYVKKQRNGTIIICKPKDAQGITFMGNTYNILNTGITLDENASTVQLDEITRFEFDAVKSKLNKVVTPEEYDEEVKKNTDIYDSDLLENYKIARIDEFKQLCKKSILDGADIDMNGTMKHFSYSLEDQINIATLLISVPKDSTCMYHADGEPDEPYDYITLQRIGAILQARKERLISRYHMLKQAVINSHSLAEIQKLQF